MRFTVMHICAAHMVKTISQAMSKVTKDKGLHNFAVYCFALLQNCVCLEKAKSIFLQMCFVFLCEKSTPTVQAGIENLTNHIKQIALDDVDEIFLKAQLPEEDDIKVAKSTIIGRSKFTNEFGKVKEQAMDLIKEEESLSTMEDNFYNCEGIITVLTGQYLGLFPLWSGIFLGNMEKYASECKNQPNKNIQDFEKTRDTNSHVECWFGILKNTILQRKRKLRPADFISRLHSSLKGRYKEHMITHGLPLESKCPTSKRKREAIELKEEQWAKRLTTPSKSKYYSVPVIMPVPKKLKTENPDRTQIKSCVKTTKKNMNIQHKPILTKASNASKVTIQQSDNRRKKWSEIVALKDPEEKKHALWETEIKEAVIAVLPSNEETTSCTFLRVTDFKTLRPQTWLNGETIEYYLSLMRNQHEAAKKIIIISHFTVDVIMNEEEEVIKRQLMSKVKIDNFDAALGVLNLNENHWILIFLNATSKKVYVLDPFGRDEEEQAKKAGEKFRRYFQIRTNILGRKEWSNLRWSPMKIKHTKQMDGSSCGVFVMKFGEEILSKFPNVPCNLTIDKSTEAINDIRTQMATAILASSEPQSFCPLCGCKEIPGNVLWIQCDGCLLWSHDKCTGLTQEEVDSIATESSPWFCCFCKR
ncbi:uncharacterized protein [Misgurnus anguillicaudatus]|uniref:uncharacterized protein n=1 Tax=Misgurnus anguillicaudatus TaxID=75329 RepID=UPI003CCF955D